MRHRSAKPAPQRREDVLSLEDLPNVGPSLAGSLRLAGIKRPAQLPGQDPYGLYEALEQRTGVHHDPCVLDVFISAVRFMEGAPAHPWWHYTRERKRARRHRALEAAVRRGEQAQGIRALAALGPIDASRID
jgi:Pathogenicity locus